MNLIGRFILALFYPLFCKRSPSLLATTTRSFRVWPHDIDINVHLTAARYLSFGDLARLGWMADNRILWQFFFKGYQSVINAQEITYIREFRPFSKVRVDMQLVSWDHKYSYFEQRYYCGDRLYAVGHARSAMLASRKVVTPQSVYDALDLNVQSPIESEIIADWKETLDAKKRQFS